MPPIAATARKATVLTGRMQLSCTRHRARTTTTAAPSTAFTTTMKTTARATTRTPATMTARRHSTKPPSQARAAAAAPPPQRPKKTSLLSAYTTLLETRPLATKAVTSGVIAFAGDITCQVLAIESTKRREIQTPIPLDEPQDENDDEDDDELLDAPEAEDDGVVSEIDWGRTLRFTLIGATFLAPALHTWYGVLMRRLPGTAPATVVKRVALDQLVFSPVFLAAFLSTVMVLDGRAAKIEQKLRADYTTTVVSNWGYWIPAQVLNFRFVPPPYQVLFANFVGFFWNIYLSYQANKAVIKDTAASGESIETDL